MTYAYRREVTLYQKTSFCSRGKDIFDMRGIKTSHFISYVTSLRIRMAYESKLKDPIVTTFETAHDIAELIKSQKVSI